MKRFLTLTAITMTLFTAGCGENLTAPGVLPINNTLTADEIAAGVLTPEIMWKMGRIGEFTLSPDGSCVAFTTTYYSVAENRGVTQLNVKGLGDQEAKRHTGVLGMSRGDASRSITGQDCNASNPVWSTDGSHIYYLSDKSGSSQIWCVESRGEGSARQISDFDFDVEYFGIAPSGDRMFYVRRVKVEPRVSSEIYPDLDKSAARVYDDLMVRHWDRWTDGTHLHIFVADFDAEALASGRGTLAAGVDIMAGEAWDAPMEPYFDASEIAWNNAGTILAYTCKKLTGTQYALSTDSDIYLYDVARGSTVNICKPASGGAADLMVDRATLPGYDKYPVFSPDDRLIAFRSQARPGNEADKERLMVYDTATGEFADLTAGFDHSATNVVWNGPGELIFIAPWFGTLQLCRADLDGNVQLITRGEYDITALSCASGSVEAPGAVGMIVSRTRQDRAAELWAIDPSNGEMAPLTDINGHIFDNLRLGAIEKRMIPTSDGKQMLTWVVYPPDFDPTKKYPTLLYCEGGPQSTVSQMWSYRWNFQLMAAQGYIVVAPNRRGTPSFGQEWTDQISGDYSGQNIRDLLAAIDVVAAEPYVDSDRLGCVGASYGGYSSFYLAGVHQKRFKAFIAHCGIYNFESMYGTTEELFFPNNDYGGPYWSTEAVAVRSYAHSPHKSVQNWDTPILIIAGLNDFRVPYSQSLEAHTAARLVGVPSRLVVFENEAHQVFKPQNNLAWNREFFGWLDRYVKNPGAEAK